jgi:hypothetical protein
MAFVMSKRHQAIADQLSTTFPVETIKKWEEMVKKWEKDKMAPNPYAEPQCSKLFGSLRGYHADLKLSDNAPSRAS